MLIVAKTPMLPYHLSMRRVLSLILMLMSLLSIWAKPDTPYDARTCIAYDYILSKNQKKLVDFIYEKLSKYEFSITFEEEVCSNDLDVAISHILSDYPELFYVSNHYQYFYYEDKGWISKVEFSATMTEKEAKNIEKDMFSLIEGLIEEIPPSLSPYSKELLLHDVLAQLVTYTQEGDISYTPYGALLYGRATCEGYAEAFTLMLRMAGIPCSKISGKGYTDDKSESHAWNIVELDGVFTLVDVTWDDMTDIVSHLYFNITDEMIKRDHETDEIFSLLPASKSLRYNYHEINGIIFDESANMENVTWSMFDYARGTGDEIEVRFKDRKAYSLFLDSFPDAAQNYANEHGDISYYTSRDDKQYSFLLQMQ